MESNFALREQPFAVDATILVVVPPGRDYALAIADEAGVDGAGAVRLITFDHDDVVVDEGHRGFGLAYRGVIELEKSSLPRTAWKLPSATSSRPSSVNRWATASPSPRATCQQ